MAMCCHILQTFAQSTSHPNLDKHFVLMWQLLVSCAISFSIPLPMQLFQLGVSVRAPTLFECARMYQPKRLPLSTYLLV